MMPQLLCHLFGDYILQSDWMAQNKTKEDRAAMIHALAYSLCFVPLVWFHGRDVRAAFVCWIVIFLTHFLIDRYRLARYVVWAKNWLAPWSREYLPKGEWENLDRYRLVPPNPPLADCPTGYPPTVPPWMAVWLLIIADNTLHLAINYLALRCL